MARVPVDALVQVSHLVRRAQESCARQHGLSPTLARLLGTLESGTSTMNELAALLDLDKSSTSGLIDRAERRGLVRRIPSQIDRRAVRVRLTKSGLELEQQLRTAQTNAVTALLEPLPDADRQSLLGALTGILAAQAHL